MLSLKKQNLIIIFRLQKRAARIILDANLRSRSLPLFNTWNWLPFFKDAFVNRCTLTLKRTLGKALEYLKSMFQLHSDIHSDNWNTRFSKLNLGCPIYNNSTEGGRGTFTVRSIKDWWNNWRKALKNSSNKNTRRFKMKLVKILLKRERKREGEWDTQYHY